jgi:membrane protein DedA with SNARE-associated domain
MARLIQYLVRYGVSLVFLNVFAEQIGAPVPAVPTLIVAGALARNGQISSTHIVLIAAVSASLIADWIWFLLGRRYGYRILRTLCRISLSPDSCVRDTEARFERWGLKSLLFAKFVPGFSTVAPPLAGAAKRGTAAFLLYDGIGALLWAGSAVAVGRLFHRQIAEVMAWLEAMGGWALIAVGSVLALFILMKWWQRARFLKQLRIARVSVHELKEMIARDEQPVVLDVRTPSSLARDPRRIPTAIVAHAEEIDATVAAISPDREIVLYCT